MALMTSWLQMSLHKDPLRRGAKTSVTECAPCLTDMEHNLNTLVWYEDHSMFSMEATCVLAHCNGLALYARLVCLYSTL